MGSGKAQVTLEAAASGMRGTLQSLPPGVRSSPQNLDFPCLKRTFFLLPPPRDVVSVG